MAEFEDLARRTWLHASRTIPEDTKLMGRLRDKVKDRTPEELAQSYPPRDDSRIL